MELAVLVIGVIGNVISISVFVSPVPTFCRIIRKRATEDFSAMPYLMSFFSQMAWTYYGAICPTGFLVMLISAIGCAIELVYIITYIVLAPKAQKLSTIRFFSFCVCSFGCILAGTLMGARGSRRLLIVGFLCDLISICMYASPLSIMKQVVTTKSVEFMPFFLSLALFLCGGIWGSYALVTQDLFVGVPNVIGFLLGIMQLILYLVYYKANPKQLQAGKDISTLPYMDKEKPHLLDGKVSSVSIDLEMPPKVEGSKPIGEKNV